MHGGLRGSAPERNGRVERAPDNAGISLLSVSNLAGFVDFFAGKADIGGYETFLIWNGFWAPTAGCFAATLLSAAIIDVIGTSALKLLVPK